MATAAREIERKFVIRKLPPKLDDYPHEELEQGYLAITPDGVQVRLRRSEGGCTLTYKSNAGVAREEREIGLTSEQFDALWPATSGRRLAKTRYRIPHGELTIEVDLYHGRHEGLMVSEVEFPDSESARRFQPPDWLGDDVTHDPRYSNQLLACAPAPTR